MVNFPTILIEFSELTFRAVKIFSKVTVIIYIVKLFGSENYIPEWKKAITKIFHSRKESKPPLEEFYMPESFPFDINIKNRKRPKINIPNWIATSLGIGRLAVKLLPRFSKGDPNDQTDPLINDLMRQSKEVNKEDSELDINEIIANILKEI